MIESTSRLPVTVLSGFLGAGKTTVLKGKAYWKSLNDPFPRWQAEH